LLWFVPLDGRDPCFLQVDSLSFHLLQISPVTSGAQPGFLLVENGVRTLPSEPHSNFLARLARLLAYRSGGGLYFRFCP
jgi:hypothetical protein